MKLLVITTLPDPHLEMLKAHLPPLDQVLIFDPSQIPTLDFTYKMTSSGLTIATSQEMFSDVDVVWYRKPLLIDISKYPVEAKYKELAYESYTEFVHWFYSSLQEKPWVSNYWSIKRASSKPLQMEFAYKVGFLVPETLITNSSVQAQLFLEQYNVIVAKPLNIAFIRDAGKLLANYASVISLGDPITFDGLSVSPYIFQREVKGTDIRVTIIGGKVFPCRILKSGNLSTKLDWRQGFYEGGLTFEIVDDFPSVLAEKCSMLIKRLGLVFGTVDFIHETETDQYWFLEVNPNGQWAFVEMETGVPLSYHIARMLQSLA